MSFYVLTGEREAGKSTFCQHLYQRVLDAGGLVSGLITLTDRKEKLTALDLFTNETCLLAEANSGRRGKLHTGLWSFHEEAVKWGNLRLASPPPSDLFILDEAGILEFKRNEGWSEGMKRLDSRKDRVSVVVIRPELLETALSRWTEAEILCIDLPENQKRNKLIQKILNQGFL